jgi:hypothetical protein
MLLFRSIIVARRSCEVDIEAVIWSWGKGVVPEKAGGKLYIIPVVAIAESSSPNGFISGFTPMVAVLRDRCGKREKNKLIIKSLLNI